MKNFFLSLFVFPFFSILTACGALFGTQTEESNTGPCTAPDSTYAYSTQQKWKTLSYDLVFCWSAEEVTTAEGQAVLFLEKGDGSAWVQITLMSGAPEAEKPTPIVTQNDDETTTYVYESYFTVVTNAPDDNDVQSILLSLNREMMAESEIVTIEWKGTIWAPLDGIAPCLYGTTLVYWYEEELEMSPGDTACYAPTHLAGDAPMPIVAWPDSYTSLQEVSAKIDEEFKDDPYYKATWGEIENHTNANGVSYQTQSFRYEGNDIIGVPTGIYVWVDLAENENILFEVQNHVESLVEALVDQIQAL